MRRFNFLLTRILVSAMLYLTRIIVILTWIIVGKGDERMPLYNRLKEHRARLGLKQEDLANLVGVRRETIGNLEKGRYNPSLVLAWNIAKVFHVSIEDIFTVEDQIER